MYLTEVSTSSQEKELKRLHDEAEKEERRRQKEENDMQKQLKRQQEEAEKDQRRKEKEEAEMRKQLALQKQASLMERFLKRNKTNSTSQNDGSMSKATTSGSSSNMLERTSESVTLAMDSALAQNCGLDVEDIWKFVTLPFSLLLLISSRTFGVPKHKIPFVLPFAGHT